MIYVYPVPNLRRRALISSSGSLAVLAAMRRASSLVSRPVTEHRLGSSSSTNTQALGRSRMSCATYPQVTGFSVGTFRRLRFSRLLSFRGKGHRPRS